MCGPLRRSSSPGPSCGAQKGSRGPRVFACAVGTRASLPDGGCWAEMCAYSLRLQVRCCWSGRLLACLRRSGSSTSILRHPRSVPAPTPPDWASQRVCVGPTAGMKNGQIPARSLYATARQRMGQTKLGAVQEPRAATWPHRAVTELTCTRTVAYVKDATPVAPCFGVSRSITNSPDLVRPTRSLRAIP